MERYELQYTGEEIDRLLGSIDIKSISYGELKTLRDNAQLNAGQWYRITDYQCTTTQENTQSAGHQFDIIVRADSGNVLNENAYAANHIFNATSYEINEGDNNFVYPADCEERSVADAMSGFTPENGDRVSEVVGTKFALYHPVYGWGGNLNTLQPSQAYTYTSQSPEKKTLSFAPSDYFANCKLSAWTLKYCLDNDTSRFAWADAARLVKASLIINNGWVQQTCNRDTTYDFDDNYAWVYSTVKVYTKSETPSVNDIVYVKAKGELIPSDYVVEQYLPPYITRGGYGVIYYMKDEWNNECPYDFKNIQFQRYKITACTKSLDLVGLYGITGVSDYTVDGSTPYWCYTFCVLDTDDDYAAHDVSVEQELYPNNEGSYSHSHDNVFKPYYMSVKSGDNMIEVVVLPDNVCVTDTSAIEDAGGFYAYYSNTFGSDCTYNTFGNGCYSNTLGNTCYYNTFGSDCTYNTFGNACYYNTFVNDCSSNTFGNGCSYNTFGNNCYSNTFGNECYFNKFGNICYSNIFGNNFYYNTFGNICYSNIFGNYIRQLTVFEGAQYCSVTGGSDNSAYVQNAQILNGTKAIKSDLLTITFVANVNYTQIAGLNSSDVLKIWTPADLVQ